MTLKNDKISSIEKKIEIEAILGSLDEERFALLVNLCKKITDFGHDPTAGKDKRIDGIPVQFDNVDDDDNVEDVYDEVRGEKEDVSEDEIVMAEDSDVEGVSDIEFNEDTFSNHGKGLCPLDIDAHWLQRKLSKYFEEAKKAMEVLHILQKAQGNRECENQLVLLLGYDCCDFIKLLLKNKEMILHCTQSDIEKVGIKNKIGRDNELIKILKQLEGSVRDRGNDETLSDVDDYEDEDYCPTSPKRSRPSSPMRSRRSSVESKTKRISLEVPIDLVARTTLVASDIRISPSQQTKLLASVILASKGDISQFSISSTTARRERQRVEALVADKIKEDFRGVMKDPDVKVMVHFDGKKLPSINTDKVHKPLKDRVAVILKWENGEQLIGIPELPDGKGMKMSLT